MATEFKEEAECAIKSQLTHGDCIHRAFQAKDKHRWFAIAFLHTAALSFPSGLPFDYWAWPTLLSIDVLINSG